MPRRIVAAVMFLVAAVVLSSGLWVYSLAAPPAVSKSAPKNGFCGVFFNPNIKHVGMAGYPWPIFDPYGPEYRAQIRRHCRNWPEKPTST